MSKNKEQELKKRNTELKIQVAGKARQLKIETALEKVRAVAMSMKQPADMLKICKTISLQLQSLGVLEIRNVQTAIFYESKGTYMNYEYYAKHNKTFITETIYTNHKIAKAFAEKMLKGRGEFYNTHIKGKKVKDWIAYQKKTNVFIDKYLNTAPSLNYYWYSLGPVALGISAYHPLTEEETNLFKRFLKVFGLAYRRYLDIEQAIAQAREAKIEAALERVRSRTMAMFKTDELNEVVFEFFNQMNPLGFAQWACIIALADEDKGGFNEWLSTPTDRVLPECYHIPKLDHPAFEKMWSAYIDQVPYLTIEMKGVEKHNWDLLVFEKTDFKKMPQAVKDSIFAVPEVAFSLVPMRHGLIIAVDIAPIPEDMIKILARFAKVFEQTYTRFLDLQKAEAQAREAKIEAALEKVRSRSMGMQKSEELKEVIQVVYDQFVHLNIHIEHTGFIMDYKTRDDMHIWLADKHAVPFQVTIPYFDSPHWNSFNEAKEKGIDFFANNFTFEEKNKFYKKLFKHIPVPEDTKEFYFSCPGLSVSTVLLDNVGLYVENFSGTPYTDEENNTLMRFGKVFQQTYTRFLDLEKAEAQAREAQIEASLERVRSRAMAMHKTDELLDAAELVYKELTHLGITSMAVSYAFVNEEEKNALYYGINPVDGKIPPIPFVFPHTETDVMRSILSSWKKQEIFSMIKLDEKATLKHQTWVGEHIQTTFAKNNIPFSIEAFLAVSPQTAVIYSFNFAQGYIFIIGEERLTTMQEEMVLRFTKVFEMTYRRFLDLKKAEAQARESQIQLALERVRARTMAMQKSDELADAAIVLFNQVKDLGINTWTTGFNLWEDDSSSYTDWITSPQGVFVEPYKVDTTKFSVFMDIAEARKRGDEFFVSGIEGEIVKQLYQHLSSFGDKKQFEKLLEEGFEFPTHQINHFVFGSQVSLLFITYEPCPEAHDIFKRFGKVFEQTYTRFLDLQKAEAQAREAQIQLALERVRARTMAMQKRDELTDAASLLFKQIADLGIKLWSNGFQIWNADDISTTAWPSAPDGSIQAPFRLPYNEDIFFKRIYEARQSGKDFFVMESSGKELEDTYHYMFNLPGVKKYFDDALDSGFAIPKFQITHCAFFAQGYLMFITYEPVPEAWDIFKRFAKVFEQTYTRFLDLQKAEAQAREAVKQASVDRVRAEIASMRTTNDLERIQPLIWNELTTLGVPFIRCGVFIMDEEQKQVQSFLSTPDGKSIAAFRQPYNSPGEIAQIVQHWHQKKIYKQHWNEAQFIEFTKNLIQQGAITSGEKYLTENRPTDLYLHFLPFMQGMLYAGSTTALSDDELQLVQNLAGAFSTAYARYEDFNKLELAKEQIEKTLVDLKQTQAQLVQSEKMASLGELTAGIAHEIQNPLNFVNNFSEVSKELLDEMKAELDSGNTDDAKEIANDVIQNLEKINHHGKRADAIVKGMLQHSRSSSNVKEPTDINALTDEYIRLCYHGLRAKDKSFNATIKTDFDNSLEKINIIPQDIGRVILNLLTNAFYAVSEKQKQNIPGYEPAVTIKTTQNSLSGGRGAEIRVSDNGNGIPKKILDKIFQPFFTTKPTGQGTGLGLSLSYDIVKAHGGEIKIETKEMEGTIFIIQLPT